ncbi:MAG: CPBP family intramembrane metalloprotease, partial [Spirochaetota bacterium]|nr:CPBP family intramembrane metalloprotease [Spirochaetota bacterium]
DFMGARIVVYSLFSVIITAMIGTSIYLSNVMASKNELFFVERSNMPQAKLIYSLKLMGYPESLYKGQLKAPDYKPSTTDYRNNVDIVLNYTVLLDILQGPAKPLDYMRHVKMENNSLRELLILLFINSDFKPDPQAEKLIKSQFKDEFYRLYLLQKYYRLTGDKENHIKAKNKLSSISWSFLLFIFLVVILLISFSIAGIVLFIIWIIQWKRQRESSPIVITHNMQFPALDAYGIVLIWILTSLALQQLFGGLAAILMFASGNEEALLDGNFPAHILIMVVFVEKLGAGLLVFLIIYVMVINKEKIPFKLYFKKLFNFSKSTVLSGGAAYLVAVPIVYAISYISGLIFEGDGLKSNPILEYLLKDTDLFTLTEIAIMIVILAPLIEEIVFRGILFRHLLQWKGFMPAAIISGLIFGLVHANLATIIPITALGFILAWTAHRTKSITAPVVTHAIWNAMTLIFTLNIYK